MPVPSSIDDLDTTPDNNSPAGTESAKGTVDNYFRAHAAFIAQNRDEIASKDADIAAVAASVTAHTSDTTAAHAASAVSFAPTGNIAATDVQTAIAELDTEKAHAASPTFTGAIYNNGSQQGNITAVSALAIDCSVGNYFTKTINGNSTFTVSNVPSGKAYGFTLELTHTSGTVTWFSGVQWPNNTAPTLTTGKVHLFMFLTDDGGTSWRGAALVDYAS